MSIARSVLFVLMEPPVLRRTLRCSLSEAKLPGQAILRFADEKGGEVIIVSAMGSFSTQMVPPHILTIYLESGIQHPSYYLLD